MHGKVGTVTSAAPVASAMERMAREPTWRADLVRALTPTTAASITAKTASAEGQLSHRKLTSKIMTSKNAKMIRTMRRSRRTPDVLGCGISVPGSSLLAGQRDPRPAAD